MLGDGAKRHDCGSNALGLRIKFSAASRKRGASVSISVNNQLNVSMSLFSDLEKPCKQCAMVGLENFGILLVQHVLVVLKIQTTFWLIQKPKLHLKHTHTLFSLLPSEPELDF